MDPASVYCGKVTTNTDTRASSPWSYWREICSALIFADSGKEVQQLLIYFTQHSKGEVGKFDAHRQLWLPVALRGASQGAKYHAELCLAGVAPSGRATRTSWEKEKACERRLIRWNAKVLCTKKRGQSRSW